MTGLVHRIVPLCLVILVSLQASGCLFGWFGKDDAQERRIERAAKPAELRALTTHSGDVRVARIRAWADSEYRTENPGWQERLAEQLDHASSLLIPLLGLRLELAETRDWQRTAADDLDGMLAELAAADDAKGVDWVVGLVPASPQASTAIDSMGHAKPLGRHILLRGYNDLEERRALAERLPNETIPEKLHEERRWHKQSVVLVHELAHTLGALHTRDERWIMHPTYASTIASFATPNVELMEVLLDLRLRQRGVPQDVAAIAEAGAMLTHLQTNPWGGWVSAAYDSAVGSLEEALARQPVIVTEHKEPVPQEAMAPLARARALLETGEQEAARVAIAELVTTYPANAEIRTAQCSIALATTGPNQEETAQACARAAELAPAEPTAELELAAAQLAAGNRAGAMTALGSARDRMKSASEVPEAMWAQLVRAYQSASAVTAAEELAPRTGAAAASVQTWASEMRRRFGLPVDASAFAIAAEDEPVYLALVQEILALTYADQHRKARSAAMAALQRYPDAPGLLAALCDVEIRQHRFAAARPRCERAIALQADNSWARYLLGIVELHFQRNQLAIEHLRRALADDPGLAQAWRSLAQAYQRIGDGAALEALGADYQQRFGQPL